MTETVIRDPQRARTPTLTGSILSVALASNVERAGQRFAGQCFAAGPSGLYQSHDQGQTWEAIIVSDIPVPVLAVAVSPDFAHDGQVVAGITGGVLRSWNCGRTWRGETVGAPPATVSNVAFSPNFSADSLVFAGTDEDGLFRSTDRGVTWQPWNFGLLDRHVLCLSVSPNFAVDETVFVGTHSGLFRSKNGGRAWRETTFPNQAAPVQCLAFSPDFERDGTIYAGTESAGLFISTDRGQSWSSIDADTLGTSISAIAIEMHSLALPQVLVACENGVWLSRDGGVTWATWADRIDVLTLAVTGRHFAEPCARVLAGLGTGGVQWLSPLKLKSVFKN